MKNLKKVLALVLAFACAFTMFAGAAFTDEADIQAKDAVSMLTTLGVIEGYEDGSFQPEGTVTRAEMAKMIFVVRNNTADDQAYANVSTTLTDINGHWAEGYIKFCESQGIIAGKGNGIFDPDATVTGTEAAKMLLVLAGYEPKNAGLEGTNWATNTLKHAGAAGILSKVSSGLESGLPRQWAAQMIYNTLSANRVVWSADSNSFDDVLNGGVKETVGRAYMGLYATVGTLVTVDLDRLVIDQASIDENESDSTASIWNDGKWNLNYEDVFTKVTTDYSDLLGQKVKVMFKDANTSKVLGVFAVEENTVYTVAANQTSKDGDKVAFDGASYRLDGEGVIRTYMNGDDPFWTTLDELDSNALNPNMYTFIDSDGNGRLDTLVVKTYDVAQVTYAASDKIIANAVTYKYADENIADGIEKDDWVIITENLFEDKLDIVKADVQTGTLDALRNNRNKDVYFDGDAVAPQAANYNEYQIGDNWYNGGEFVEDGSAAVRSDRSTNDLNAVKAGDSVDYVAVNGIMFSVKKSTGENVGRVDSAALIVAIDNTNVADRAKIALFDGTTKTVEYNAGDSVSPLVPGTVYEYSVSGSEYTFEDLECGIDDNNPANGDETDYENYYGDLTYMGDLAIDADEIAAMEEDNTVAASDGTNYTIDDNAQVLLFAEHPGENNQVKKLTGKQFKALDLENILGAGSGVTLEIPSVAYGFYGSMNGLSRVGALAVQVDDDTNLDNVAHRTWSNYAVIVSDAKYIVRNKTIQYDIWTGTETLTVQEDHNRIDDRTANTAIGYDDLTVIGSANAAALIMRAATATHEIEGVDALSADVVTGDLTFTAITKVSNDGKTVQFADGTERDASGATILYIDSDGKVGIADGKTVAANKNVAGNWMANALYSISSGNDIELLIVDQGEYLKSDTYKDHVFDPHGNTVYGDTTTPVVPDDGDTPAKMPETEEGYTVNMMSGSLKVADKAYNNGYVYFQLRSDELTGMDSAIIDYTISDNKGGMDYGDVDVVRENGEFKIVKLAYTPSEGATTIRLLLNAAVAQTYQLTAAEGCLLDLGNVTTIEAGAKEIKATVKFPAGVASATAATIKVNGLTTGIASITQDGSSFTNDASGALTDGKEVVITLNSGADSAIELSTTATLTYKASIDVSAVTASATTNNIAEVKVSKAPAAVAATTATYTDGEVAVTLLNPAVVTADKLIVSYTVNGVAQADAEVTCAAGQAQKITTALDWSGDAEDLTNVTTDGVKIVITNIQFQKKSNIELKNASLENLENIVSEVMINTTADGVKITDTGVDFNLIAGKEYTLKVTAGSTVGSNDVKVVLKYDTKTVELGTIPANTAEDTELTFTFTAPYDLAATATIEKAS